MGSAAVCHLAARGGRVLGLEQSHAWSCAGIEPRPLARHSSGVLRASRLRAAAAARLRTVGSPRARHRPIAADHHRRADDRPAGQRRRQRQPAQRARARTGARDARRAPRSGAAFRRSRRRRTHVALFETRAGVVQAGGSHSCAPRSRGAGRSRAAVRRAGHRLDRRSRPCGRADGAGNLRSGPPGHDARSVGTGPVRSWRRFPSKSSGRCCTGSPLPEAPSRFRRIDFPSTSGISAAAFSSTGFRPTPGLPAASRSRSSAREAARDVHADTVDRTVQPQEVAAHAGGARDVHSGARVGRASRQRDVSLHADARSSLRDRRAPALTRG